MQAYFGKFNHMHFMVSLSHLHVFVLASLPFAPHHGKIKWDAVVVFQRINPHRPSSLSHYPKMKRLVATLSLSFIIFLSYSSFCLFSLRYIHLIPLLLSIFINLLLIFIILMQLLPSLEIKHIVNLNLNAIPPVPTT
jgi:hypothetical protein